MANIQLGTLTFIQNPSKMSVIRKDKPTAYVVTFTNVAYFSWDASYIGKVLTLSWEYMISSDFDAVDAIFVADVPVSFYVNDGSGRGFTVNVLTLNGDYFGDMDSSTSSHRESVTLELLIMAVL